MPDLLVTHHHGLAPVPDVDLSELEDLFQEAFRTGNADRLDMLGAGEIAPVVGWSTASGPIACKRLPPFRNQSRLDAYSAVFHDYLDGLAAHGVDVVPTALWQLDNETGPPVAYALQPQVDQRELLPVLFQTADRSLITRVFDRLLAIIDRVLRQGIGIDAQLSNWALRGDVLVYFDVTTPFLRDEKGAHRLDTAFLTASLPWIMRGLVTGLGSNLIMDAYFVRHNVVLDLLGNLIKERLEPLMPLGVERANELLDEPVTVREVERYYRRDARLWSALQRLARWDRVWQMKVRRRPYRHLLPEPIERFGSTQ